MEDFEQGSGMSTFFFEKDSGLLVENGKGKSRSRENSQWVRNDGLQKDGSSEHREVGNFQIYLAEN